jgi:hypothetical protein
MKVKIIYIVLIALFLLGCANQNSSISGDVLNNKSADASIEKIEVYHFHGTNQCYSCITVGAYAEETINTYYSNELQSGKIVFSSINYDLPENKVTAMKYGVSGSSLWIGVYDSTGFHHEQNTNVWYKISNKEDYMSYLKGIIDQKLAGN